MLALYNKLKDKEGKVIEILEFHVNNLIQSAFCRLAYRQKYRKPRCIEVTKRGYIIKYFLNDSKL